MIIRRNFFKYRIKGGALYYAIFVMLLLSMFSLFLLSYVELSYRQDVLFYKAQELNSNITSSITLVSCQPSLLEDKTPIDIFNDGSAMVQANVTAWGLLKKVEFSSFWRNQIVRKIVLMAEKEEARCALWMPDRKKYVSLVGNSYINGDCYLSELGLRKGNAEGRYFEGPYLYKGSIKKSSAKMPGIKEEDNSRITSYLKGITTVNDSVVPYSRFQSNTEIVQSFKQKTLLLQASSNINLNKGTISDNVIIYSSDTIFVWPSVQIFDALLMAKAIVFKSGCKNRLQAFASKRIMVEDGCVFNYPSFLGAFSNTANASLNVGDNVKINGGVFTYAKTPEETKTTLTIGQGAVITGKAYVNGDLSFKGKIIGSLYCDRFVYSTPRAFYENFILDAVIDESKLPEEYASYCLDNENVFKLKEVRVCN